MNKVKYYSTAKLSNALMESLSGTRFKRKDKFKASLLESVSKKVVLTEALVDKLNGIVDELMKFFKNSAENNKRIDYLVNLLKKGKELDIFREIPALRSALYAVGDKPIDGDRLKTFLKLWLEYITIQYQGRNPFIMFNVEVKKLEDLLKGNIGNESLQGPNRNIDQLLSEHGLISTLKKLSLYINEEVGKMSSFDEKLTDKMFGYTSTETKKDKKKDIFIEATYVLLLDFLAA
jgi:hypothetical protein